VPDASVTAALRRMDGDQIDDLSFNLASESVPTMESLRPSTAPR
jgi:hypothetical protein